MNKIQIQCLMHQADTYDIFETALAEHNIAEQYHSQ